LSFVGGHDVANVARKIPSVAKLMTSNAVTFDRITLFRASESISLKCAPTLSLAIDKISVAASDLARHRNICVAGIVSAARGKITSIDLNPVDRASGSAIVADALIEIKNAKKAS
jgi:hypothetical protein